MATNQKDWTNKKVDRFVVVNNELGKGAFGVVYRGYYAEDEQKLVACKAIPIKEISSSQKMLELIKREINILQKVNNKHIVRLYDVARTQHNLYMFLEYCMDGDLKEYLKKKDGNRLSEQEALMFLRHIVEGFKELHKHKIIHRDIKPANIMLTNGLAKISDFGFARILDNQYDTPALLSRLGSPLYMAPQILEGTAFSAKCDVWSVGVVFFEMLYGKTPWIGENQYNLLQNIKEKQLKFPENPSRSDKTKELLKKMLRVNEEDRLAWDQIFELDIIKQSTTGIAIGLGNAGQGKSAAGDSKNSSMEQSIMMNEKYVENNLVVGYLRHNMEELKQEEDKQSTDANSQRSAIAATSQTQSKINEQQKNSSSEVKQSNTQAMKDGDVSKVLGAQQQAEKLRKKILQINEYILYERNIAFFFNFVIQKLIRCFNSGKLQIPSEFHFRLLFIICKNQNISLTKIHVLLNDKTCTEFSQQLWTSYQQSNEYSKTLNLIKNDILHSQKFFEELLKKTQEIIKKTLENEQKSPKKDQLSKFSEILDQSFENSQTFKAVYQNTLVEIINNMKSSVNNKDTDKELLVILKYMYVCKNPYEEFTESSFDFNKFYEDIENIQNEDLRKGLLNLEKLKK